MKTTARVIKKRFRNRILRYLLMCSFVPVLVWVAIAYFSSIEFLGSFLEKELKAASNETVVRIETWKSRNQSILTFLQQELSRAATHRPGEWLDILKAAHNSDEAFYGAFIHDLKGNSLARSDGGKVATYGDREWHKRAIRGEVYHEFLISRAWNKPAMCSAGPVYRQDKISHIATICAFTDQMHSYLGNLKVGKTGYIFVLDDTDRIIIHPRIKMLSTELAAQEKIALDLLKSGQRERSEIEVSGKTYVAYLKSISNGWSIIAIQDKNEILSWAREYLQHPIALTMITILILTLLTIFAIDKSTQPLHDLSRATDELGRTNLDVRVPIKNNDELGMLAKSFNEMAERLQSTFHQLKEKETLLERHRDHLHQQVTEQSQKLLYSAKMSSLGEMAGGIAHEINNPLAIISLLVQKLRAQFVRGNLSQQSAVESMDKIEATCLRITQIIRGLRAFSRDGSKDPFILENLSSIIQDSEALCTESLRSKKIRLDVYCPEDLEIECQPIQISQVLLNLISNSKDAIANLNDRWIRIEAASLGDRIELSVTDSGCGVADHLKEKIMQPFYTTKKVGEGTGLGLSICKGIVEQHQGQLFLNAMHPQTQFIVVLPKRQARRKSTAGVSELAH